MAVALFNKTEGMLRFKIKISNSYFFWGKYAVQQL
jgi:hypothetical protein